MKPGPYTGVQAIGKNGTFDISLIPVESLHNANQLMLKNKFLQITVITANQVAFRKNTDDPVHNILVMPAVQNQIILGGPTY